ncbi:uncharacterized protein L969DRAFT_74702 [Mixia osmundae IAM 14324]|uniref:Cytochrome c oxidase assembly factor 3 n=1 Tax=Mixia osmundae (strain CBS 9802 / IAM 14324 / JCM 22182 / KY 12970) TaxID=764103 RepID=G7E0V6_MIXOS|nr:uncharacterized protein L969DRAFT_74702 [Mixia osmundae IAM 14324]KEI39496.1 hypothetical protein L969DRAFT_74702 [Mixia osmundae IAM 14324]GAA96466.1 hypothetical protein E5Q_03133 [Mixia osmundae IAM 14324]
MKVRQGLTSPVSKKDGQHSPGSEMDGLVNRSNSVVERQRALQADSRMVYQKLPRARLYMTAFMSLFAVGLAGVSYGTVKMAKASVHCRGRKTSIEGTSAALLPSTVLDPYVAGD